LHIVGLKIRPFGFNAWANSQNRVVSIFRGVRSLVWDYLI